MGTFKRFEDIEAWKTARELTRAAYSISNSRAVRRDFGLRDQLCRSAVSIMSNIAEGFESQTKPGFIRYLGIAKASSGEFRSQLYAVLDQEYISREDFGKLFDTAEKCSCQISKLMTYLKSS
ncbi:four helix bundle protein [bacterium]|nr:four helix bundle protein [bacterium]